MMSIKERLFALSNVDGIGYVREASDLACEMLSEYCLCEKGENLTVFGFLNGESDYTIMLDAHIDQIGMVVTNVDDKGFLTLAKSGGIDLRSLPSKRVTVHGKEKVTAVFCSTPPHLSKGDVEYSDIAEIKLDTTLGEKAKDVISVGDYVTFSTTADELVGSRVSGRSFDDRAGVTCLIDVAKRLSTKKLPVNVAFVLSDGEELGLRGAKTASFKVNPDEAVVIDVSFGGGIGISEEESGKLGKGPMMELSPILDKEVCKKILEVADEKGIEYQLKALGSRTGTNADVISINREGVKTGTLSIPLCNMHTDCEIVDIKDIESVCDLLEAYILSGGVKNV